MEFAGVYGQKMQDGNNQVPSWQITTFLLLNEVKWLRNMKSVPHWKPLTFSQIEIWCFWAKTKRQYLGTCCYCVPACTMWKSRIFSTNSICNQPQPTMTKYTFFLSFKWKTQKKIMREVTECESWSTSALFHHTICINVLHSLSLTTKVYIHL